MTVVALLEPPRLHFRAACHRWLTGSGLVGAFTARRLGRFPDTFLLEPSVDSPSDLLTLEYAVSFLHSF